MRYVRTILAISALLLILGCTFNRVELQNITFISLNQDELTIYEQYLRLKALSMNWDIMVI